MIAWLLWIAGCSGRVDCGAVDACPLGTSCEDGECVTRFCATSAQCPLGYHCTPGGACATGCKVQDDCPVGETCGADGTCAATPCSDAHVDCRFGEWCEAGKCVEAGDPYCKACTTDAECGAGNVCWAGQWCGVDCGTSGTAGACPAAFECAGVDHTDGQHHDVCLGACWLFQEASTTGR